MTTQHLIDDVLIGRNLLDTTGFERARRLEAESGERIDRIAAKLGLISDHDLAHAYADLLGSPLTDPADLPMERIAADRIGRDFVRRYRVVPLAEDEASLTVAMADPLDEACVRALEFAAEKTVVRRAAIPSVIEAALERLYGEARSAVKTLGDAADDRVDEDRDADLERLRDLASEAPVIRLVQTLITQAVESRASDIHIEGVESGLRVRYRIDGVLQAGAAAGPASVVHRLPREDHGVAEHCRPHPPGTAAPTSRQRRGSLDSAIDCDTEITVAPQRLR